MLYSGTRKFDPHHASPRSFHFMRASLVLRPNFPLLRLICCTEFWVLYHRLYLNTFRLIHETLLRYIDKYCLLKFLRKSMIFFP